MHDPLGLVSHVLERDAEFPAVDSELLDLLAAIGSRIGSV